MDDEQILNRGGDEQEIAEYAKEHGADLTEDDVRPEVAEAVAVLEGQLPKPQEVKRKLSKPRYTKFATEALAAQGFKLLDINWKKRRISYRTKSGAVKYVSCFGIPKGL
jgi:hypothetical protein